MTSSFFSVERGHISLLPLAILFMTQCFVLLRVLLPLSFSSRVFHLLLLSSLLSFSICLRHSGTSPSMVRCLSRPPPFPLKSSILFVSSSLLFLLFLMHVGKSSSTSMSLSLPSPWFSTVKSSFDYS